MTWDKMNKKYPEYREEMSEKREEEFVNDCFDCYEQEGFSKKFWDRNGDYEEKIGQSFKVLGRITTEEADLCCLPMWRIEFADGTTIAAYPDEIIPREMNDNGCPLAGIE